MATKKFTGNAAATFDTWTYQVVTFSSTSAHGITINGKTVGITLGTGYTAATAADAIQALLAASTYGEFLDYTWTVSTDTITATAKVAGVSGDMAKASGVSTNATLTHTVTATGPNFLDDAANWTGSTLPANNDTIVFDQFSPSALYGLDALASLTGLTFDIENFANSIGLPAVRGGANNFDPNSGGGYPEYRRRAMYLNASTPTLNIGRGDQLPARVYIEFGSSCDPAAINVFGSQDPPAGDRVTINLYGKTGMDALNVTQGSVGVAAEIGQVGGFTVVRVGAEDSPQTDAFVLFGAGATVPSVENQSGRTESGATITALTLRQRAIQHRQTGGDLTAATLQGGRTIIETNATMVLNASGTAVVDCSRDPRPKTISATSTFEDDAALIDPAGTVTTMSCTFAGNSLKRSDLGPSTVVTRP
ncbi:MAG: hypothetical protein E6R03_01270 [Hyphomicrobiaceae bacterium]|nr:MAG: hypothetical protein E6R03_01270 [Hyphomicrobiaceae bacterium]